MLEAGGPRVPSRPVLAMVKLSPKPQALLLGSGCRIVQPLRSFWQAILFWYLKICLKKFHYKLIFRHRIWKHGMIDSRWPLNSTSGSIEVMSGVIKCCWSKMLKMMTAFLQNKLDTILSFSWLWQMILLWENNSVFPRTLIFIWLSTSSNSSTLYNSNKHLL